jgi:hypothetical protein
MITGGSGKNYLVPVAVKENEMYIAIAFNKSTDIAVKKQEIQKFYNIADDLKRGEQGMHFMGKALVELENINEKRSKDPETKINFNMAKFENQIYSSMRY